jgi:hypothetical protein
MMTYEPVRVFYLRCYYLRVPYYDLDMYDFEVITERYTHYEYKLSNKDID